jgi:hypothetical protein
MTTPITHDATTDTWTITHGTRTLTGFPTREAAAETLYDLERGRSDLAIAREIIDEVEAELAGPRISVERRADMPTPCVEYRIGGLILEILDDSMGQSPNVYGLGGDGVDLTRAAQDARDLLSLLMTRAYRQRALGPSWGALA